MRVYSLSRSRPFPLSLFLWWLIKIITQETTTHAAAARSGLLLVRALSAVCRNTLETASLSSSSECEQPGKANM